MAEPRPTKRVRWPSGQQARERVLNTAVHTLRAGGLVAFPTDTVYGVAADPTQPAAVERLFALKQRPPSKQIALLASGAGQIEQMGLAFPAVAVPLAERYWPGPLTLVLRASDGGTVGVRVPDHPLVLALLERFGSPLATTSANRSSAPSTRTADEVLAQLPSGIDLLLDGGPTPGGVDSTVLDLSGPEPFVLRQGAVPRADLEQLIGPLTPRGDRSP